MAHSDRSDPPRKGWLRVAFFVSLALNLAVAGIVAGALLRGGPPRPPSGPPRDAVLPYTRAFSEEQRHELGRALRRAARADRENGAERGDFLSDYTAMLTLLRQEPLDRDALRALLQRQGSRALDRQARGQQVLEDFLAGMNAQDRNAFADRLEAQVQKFEDRRKRWDKDKDKN